MTRPLAEVVWPADRLGEAIETLGRAGALAPASRAQEVPAPPADVAESSTLSRWIETTAAWLSLEAEPVEVSYADVESFVRGAGPAIVRVGRAADAPFVAIVRAGKRTVTVVDGVGVARRVRASALVQALQQPLEAPLAGDVDRMLERTVSPRRRARARAALLRELLGRRWVGGLWLLRSRPGSSLAHLAWRARLPRLLAFAIGAHAAEYALTLLSWWAVAQGALQGRMDRGWLAAWLLMLLTLVPFRFLSAWSSSRLAVGAGTLLKTRLLVGALRLDPNDIRHQGSGQLLGRVLESSAVEILGLGGGLASILALVDLVLCLAVLSRGSGGQLHVALMVGAIALTAALGWRHLARRRRWTDVRLSMTHDLVERMVGHRTRIAQEPRARWHDGEDQMLERYLVASRDLDGATIALSLVPRTWLLLGIAALAPGIMMTAPSATGLALALGGILLGYGALQTLAGGVSQLAGALIGWRQARPLVAAAARADVAPAPTVASAVLAPRADGSVLIDAKDLRFRYRARGEPVLRGCSLRIRVGDRLLVEGPSGGGKSTLGSLLTGLRAPESGLLLLGGLDRQVLGADGWRRRVVAAPQFHENHVFGATFAFNLLMGRGWPPAPRDLEAAEAICRELDLGPLLDRMPAGLQQMVGETGWQLSHGEKSRLYIARALLQNADLVVLDESFAALDPETLNRALRCVLGRARTVLVIAHP